jgi:ATP-dependent DNA helicase RecG
VIGTHALFQKSVLFNRLGLVIIDEQHKFGVLQRLALREKGERQGRMPHQLVMTATPIPRTLTMSLYADMDCSVIDELPPGRTPVTTSVLPDTRRDEVVERVMSACRKGAQAYWVCTLIEESEVLECQAAEATAETLTAQLDGLRVRLIHGRMSGEEKTQIMADFKQGDVDLLVATTVIEVGVDVPNASLMVIENPERLGLAQLHQLRGRIGRGINKSHCVLLYHPPLGITSKQRLNVMRESNDGFYIAEQDLKIRGPGEMFGQRQSGSLQFRIADLVRDQHMLDAVSSTSRSLLASNRVAALTIMHRWLTMPEAFSQV